MKLICIFFLSIVCQSFAQQKENRPLKFEGEIKGVFEVVKIDSSNSINLTTLKLKYLLNVGKDKNIEIPTSYEAVVYTEKVKVNWKKNDTKYKKLQVGSEYYFDLKHIFFYRSLHPAPNEIPYALDVDGKRIWEESRDYGVYTATELKGIYYIN